MAGSGARPQVAFQSAAPSNPISNHAGALHGPGRPASSQTRTAQ